MLMQTHFKIIQIQKHTKNRKLRYILAPVFYYQTCYKHSEVAPLNFLELLLASLAGLWLCSSQQKKYKSGSNPANPIESTERKFDWILPRPGIDLRTCRSLKYASPLQSILLDASLCSIIWLRLCWCFFLYRKTPSCNCIRNPADNCKPFSYRPTCQRINSNDTRQLNPEDNSRMRPFSLRITTIPEITKYEWGTCDLPHCRHVVCTCCWVFSRVTGSCANK